MPQLRWERGEPLGAQVEVSLRRKLKPGPGRSADEVSRHQLARIQDALLALVAEQGHDAVTVRALACRAGVSTRTFYQHYESKEACFLHGHRLASRRMLASAEAASADAPAELRPRLVVDAVLGEWTRDPRVARLLLIDAAAAVLKGLPRPPAAESLLTAWIERCVAIPPGGRADPLQTEALAAGVVGVARLRIFNGGRIDDAVCVGLVEWAASVSQLSARQVDEQGELKSSRLPSSKREDEGIVPGDRRSLILAATSRLAAGENSRELSARQVAHAAGVPCRGFEAEFSDVESCLAAAHDLHSEQAVAAMRRADGSEKALLALCARVASSPSLASLCFSDLTVSGPKLLRAHERLQAAITGLIGEDLAAEASAGAIWGCLRNRVVRGGHAEITEVGPHLVRLVLACQHDQSAALAA